MWVSPLSRSRSESNDARSVHDPVSDRGWPYSTGSWSVPTCMGMCRGFYLYVSSAHQHMPNATYVVNLLEELFEPPLSVLEIGCWVGRGYK